MNRKHGFLMVSITAVLGLSLLFGLGACSSSDDNSSSGTVTYNVVLTGAQEVPPVATAATGNATLVIDLGTGSVTGSASFSNLSTPSTGSHIHQAAAGVNGAVIVPLAGGEGQTTGVYTVPAGSALTAAQITALKANGLYLNVHSTRNPGGEIRGQITTPPGITY
jgi:hypothetical protein